MTLIPYAGYSRGVHRKAGAGAKPKAAKPIDPAYPKGKRGFAAMSPEKQREISILGGKAGGAKAPKEKRMFFVDRALALEAARKGNAASHRSKAAKKERGA